MKKINLLWLICLMFICMTTHLQAQQNRGCDISANANITLNNNDLLLRNCNDKNHGLGWYYGGKSFGSLSPDGPVLYGYRSGILGTTDGGKNGVLFWNKDGKVGIGTDKPSKNFHVAGTSKFTGELELGKFNIPAGFTTELGRNEPLINMDVNFRQKNKNNNFLGAAFRIDSRPNDPLFSWLRRSPGSTSEVVLMALSRDGDLSIGKRNASCKLDVAGSICANGTPINSDERFKKDIVVIENALTKLHDLEGVSYFMRTEEFKDRNFPESKQLGLIAQDVEGVFPELVITQNDGYKAVNYDGMIPILIEGIKEQQLIITDLEKQVSELGELQKQFHSQQAVINQLSALVEQHLSNGNNIKTDTE
jgi:hypothetical protein